VGDLLGDDSTGRSNGSDLGGAMLTMMCSDGVDLLDIDNNPESQVDVLGVSSASFSMGDTANVGGSADLLGLGTMPCNLRTMSDTHVLGSSMNYAKNDIARGRGAFGNNASVDMRPSLVTGVRSGTVQSDFDEEAEAEKTRKLNMAEGLFAGVVPTACEYQKDHLRKPIIMQSENKTYGWEIDELIPISAPDVSNINPVFVAYDQAALSNPFGMGPMGGSCSAGDIPFPSMAPPPPPMQPPPPPPIQPPPPPPAITTSTPGSDVNNVLNNNPTVEQMQAMIKQQQAQMNQMMQIMQQMQIQGSSNPPNT
jgi:hypothetical protein